MTDDKLNHNPAPRDDTPAQAPRFGLGDQVAYQRYEQRNRRLLWGLFVLLLGLAAGVFFVLPRYVAPADQAERIVVVETGRSGAAPAALSPFEEAQLLRQREAAQNTLAALLELQESLDKLSVERWAAAEYNRAIELARQGDTAYREQAFERANDEYAAGLAILQELDEGREARFATLLAEGLAALEAGRADAASQAFEIALLLKPGNAEARAGQQRAAVLNEVLAHFNRGRGLHERGELEAARAAYEEALALDAAFADARAAIAQVDRDIEARAFGDAMSRGYAALRNDNPEAAELAFREAEAMRPDSEEVKTGLQQAADMASTRIINRHMEAARIHEANEDWQAAVSEWQAAVAVDPNLVVADRGLRRSQTRLDLDVFFETVMADPLRLVEDGVYEQTRQLLVDIEQITSRGPRLQRQIDVVTMLMAEARVPVPVTLQSDNLTQVTVYRVGEFGSFTSKSLELVPGHYVAVGTRAGYRDVRREFTVDIGASAVGPIDVACTETIR